MNANFAGDLPVRFNSAMWRKRREAELAEGRDDDACPEMRFNKKRLNRNGLAQRRFDKKDYANHACGTKGSEIDHVTSILRCSAGPLFRQVPFRVSVKFPHSPQDSPYTPEGERPRVDALSRRERSDPSLAHDRQTRVAPSTCTPHSQTSRPQHEIWTGPRINHRYPCAP